MNNTPLDAQFAATDWIKSSYSAADNECVEVALARPLVGVRDSKVTQGPELALSVDAFAAFLDGVQGSGLDRIV
ncbi:DUF397 domain-containing protein [Streptomyces sp. NPDC014724]|uniref:DUF397 domain-containing protein n=1 Tax=unclassified Streptomyces TaxID=2593676 RepID=UPI0036F65623